MRPRSIPAWAGETVRWFRASFAHRVYPRVGGGNASRRIRSDCAGGLSPRGRGKRPHTRIRRRSRRSIPAWAGETGRLSYTGSASGGLSPRGRGKPIVSGESSSPSRSIPAWAGETRPTSTIADAARVYPRVGGGNVLYHAQQVISGGLSPRGRGKLETGAKHFHLWRSIPAWAGETTLKGARSPGRRVYPRVGGGNVIRNLSIAPPLGLSPRGRGKHTIADLNLGDERSIPAWAGETTARIGRGNFFEVYPRVGGGN